MHYVSHQFVSELDTENTNVQLFVWFCLNQIGKPQCSSDREFPEFFKTPLAFIPGVIMKEVMANQK